MYELTWAEQVYDEFYTQHVFAAHEVNRLYHISVELVIRLIMENDIRWRAYKRVVAHLEKAVHLYWKHYHTQKELRADYSTFDKYLRAQMKRKDFSVPVELVDTNSLDELY